MSRVIDITYPVYKRESQNLEITNQIWRAKGETGNRSLATHNDFYTIGFRKVSAVNCLPLLRIPALLSLLQNFSLRCIYFIVFRFLRRQTNKIRPFVERHSLYVSAQPLHRYFNSILTIVSRNNYSITPHIFHSRSHHKAQILQRRSFTKNTSEYRYSYRRSHARIFKISPRHSVHCSAISTVKSGWSGGN